MKYGNAKLRHELKYYINYIEYNSLRQKLKNMLQKDENTENSEGYHIRSLYFDDMFDTSLYEKNAGIFRRDKFRIRIYNKSDSHIKLERKSKYGQFISKDSVAITREGYESIIGNRPDFLLEGKHPLYKLFYGKIKNKLLQPKVVVDYLREAYVYKLGDVRITFDKLLQVGINSYDIFNREMAVRDIFKDDIMILEIKYDDYLPGFVHGLIQGSYQDISAISKYVLCRELLNNYTMK